MTSIQNQTTLEFCDNCSRAIPDSTMHFVYQNEDDDDLRLCCECEQMNLENKAWIEKWRMIEVWKLGTSVDVSDETEFGELYIPDLNDSAFACEGNEGEEDEDETPSIAVISVDEYKKCVASYCGSLMCPSKFHDSTRHFDKKYIKKECGINCGDIKRVLVMTDTNPLFVKMPNKLVKYETPMFASGCDEGSRPSERHPGMYVTDHPMGDVVIVVKNGSKFLENREVRYGAQNRYAQCEF